MKEWVRLAVFPLFAVGLAIVASLIRADDLKILWGGTRVPAKVEGMLIVRPQRIDLIDAIATEIVFELSDRRRLHAEFRNFVLINCQWISLATPSPTAGHATTSVDAAESVVHPHYVALLNEAVEINAQRSRWLLQRESESTVDGAHVVRIEKSEHASGLFGLAKVPDGVASVAGRLRPSDGTAGGTAGDVITYAVLDARDAEAMKASKGDTLVEYQQTRQGVVVEPKTKDFCLFSEPYATEFRPVFIYSAGEDRHVGISDVGRHSGPTLAIRMFRPCWAYYEDQAPERATLVANTGPISGDPLGWFSRYCEGLFSQWGMPLLIAFAASISAVVSLILISLVIWPPVTRSITPAATTASPHEVS